MGIFAFRPEKPPSFARIVIVVFSFPANVRTDVAAKKELSGLRLPLYGCEKKCMKRFYAPGIRAEAETKRVPAADSRPRCPYSFRNSEKKFVSLRNESPDDPAKRN